MLKGFEDLEILDFGHRIREFGKTYSSQQLQKQEKAVRMKQRDEAQRNESVSDTGGSGGVRKRKCTCGVYGTAAAAAAAVFARDASGGNHANAVCSCHGVFPLVSSELSMCRAPISTTKTNAVQACSRVRFNPCYEPFIPREERLF